MIRRERNCDRIWRVFSVSKGRRYAYWRFTDPRTHRTVTCRTESAAKAARAEARRAVREGEVRLVGLGQLTYVNLERDAAEKGYSLEEYCLEARNRVPAKSAQSSISISAVVERLLAALKREGKSDYWRTQVRLLGGKFAKRFPGPLCALGKAEVEEWIEGLPLKAKSRRNYVGVVQRIRSFASDQKLLPADQIWKLKPPAREQRPPGVFSPEELQEVLTHMGPTALFSVCLQAWAGFRPVEALRIVWSAVDWEENNLVAPRAKLKMRRNVPLLANLREWLEPGRGEGRIVPLTFSGWNGALARCVEKINAARALVGRRERFVWRKDGLRHSFASYQLKLGMPVAELAGIMGNSPEVIRDAYQNIGVTKAAAKAWFEIRPAKIPGVEQLELLRAMGRNGPLPASQQRRNLG